MLSVNYLICWLKSDKEFITGKMQKLLEISWFEWVFRCLWLVLWCFDWIAGSIYEEKPQLWWAVWVRKDRAALPCPSFQDWSLVWSSAIPVWPKYLHSSSLCKQKFFCWSFEIRSNRKIQSIMLFPGHLVRSQTLTLWGYLLTLLGLKNIRLIRNFPLLLLSKDQQENICLQREEECTYFGQTGM